MNVKRFILASLGAYIFIFLFDWGFHGILLDSIYSNTAHLWRTKAECQQYMHWMLFAQLLLSFVFTWIFTKGSSILQMLGTQSRIALDKRHRPI